MKRGINVLTLVVATNNPGKAREFQEILAPMGIEVKTLADFPPFPIVEDGNSFEENALKRPRQPFQPSTYR